MLFKFDGSPRVCRLLLAAIMQVQAYEPDLLTGADWSLIRKYFDYRLVNQNLPKTFTLTEFRIMEIILVRWKSLAGYPDLMVSGIISDNNF